MNFAINPRPLPPKIPPEIMTEQAQVAPAKPVEQPAARNPIISAIQQFLGVIVEFGMTTVAFGTGIYAFILVLHLDVMPEVKAGIALALTTVALVAQLWIFSRLNPRIQSDEAKDQLRTMTKLVERLVENSIQRNSNPPSVQQTPSSQNS